MSVVAARDALEAAYRNEARRVLATLIRLLGSFDAAEEAMHDAFAAAVEQWPRDGVPANPSAWLVSTARFRSIDRHRQRARLDVALRTTPATLVTDPPPDDGPLADDELRLIFTCCHPALSPDARVALTLREVAGLTTEEIARAWIVTPATIAQRIVRAKAKIRDEAIPYEVPGRAELSLRVESVLAVVYLIFNEGYFATEGPSLVREALCEQAIRLGRLIAGLLDDPEAQSLLALMLLHESRRAARVDAQGDLVLLEHQDRTRWDRAQIAAAQALVVSALAHRRVGPYTLQATLAMVHAEAPSFAETDWSQIVALYDVLLRVTPSPVVALNRAVAVAMRDGPAAGLAAVESVMASGALDAYSFAHAARADLLRRLGDDVAARAAYARALSCTQQPAERRFLEGRLRALT